VTDVTNYLKDIFKDIIQELMEAELEEKLGYAKEERSAKNTDNCRNESSKFWLGIMNDLKNRGVQDVMYPAKT